jgi:hypothetical protein
MMVVAAAVAVAMVVVVKAAAEVMVLYVRDSGRKTEKKRDRMNKRSTRRKEE